MKKIKQGSWQRQAHIAGAGLLAGFGWAASRVKSFSLPGEERKKSLDASAYAEAEQWVRSISKLKGSVVKIGQIFATYADYCLPAPLASALHILEDDTEPLNWDSIRPSIRKALGERFPDLVIDTKPIAAASISQVHRANVKKTGSEICLKVLYPGIKETLDDDISLLESGLKLWLYGENRLVFSEWLLFVKSVLLEELDLVHEAEKLRRWKKRLADDARYVVPVLFDSYSGRDILAMSFESGLSQNDIHVASLSPERRNTLAESMLELFLREVLLWGEMQTDPHPGNYRIQIGEKTDRIVLLDFGSVRYIQADLLRALRSMFLAAYHDDRKALLEGIYAAGLLDNSSPESVKTAFADVLSGLIEPLNYRARLQRDATSVPAFAVDKHMNYCWGKAQLPKRMGKQALSSALSEHFTFPGADFLLLSRKLAGVYAFIAALDARFDGSIVMEKVIKEM